MQKERKTDNFFEKIVAVLLPLGAMMLIGTAEWGTLSILYNTLSQKSSKQIVAPRFNARMECTVSLGMRFESHIR
jgi:hypothetical protein